MARHVPSTLVPQMYTLVLTLVGVAVCSLVLTAIVCVRRDRLIAIDDLSARARAIAPYLIILVGVLALNKGLQDLSRTLSLLIDWNITWRIYDLEGQVVVSVQNAVPLWLDGYFAFMYVIGYVLLLLFPILAYGLHREGRFGKELLLAYAINYGIGIVCYSLFIAYGPRNILPDLVAQPLFDGYPQVMQVTSFVNSNTNVFPSLHTSLSVTAVFMAWRTRDHYPLWTGLASILGVSILVSTMYLGIHWLIDVLAGILLGVASVALAIDLVEREDTVLVPILESASRLRGIRNVADRRRG